MIATAAMNAHGEPTATDARLAKCPNQSVAGTAAAETRASENEKKLAEERALLDDAKAKLTDTFKALASDILEEKSKTFTQQNRAGLNQLLEPFDKSLREFKTKVEDIYV